MRPARKRFDRTPEKAVSYGELDLERMARVVGVDVDIIRKHHAALEGAAVWYRLDRRAPKRIAPSHLARRLGRIERVAERLLSSLGIEHARSAADGPVDIRLTEALTLADERDSSSLLHSCARLGKLVELIDGLKAIAELRARADAASKEAIAIGKLITTSGHQGDTAVNSWIGAMASTYRAITGRRPGRSVGAPERLDEGVAGGPFIRYLEAAGSPLGIAYGSDAWAQRVRMVLAHVNRKN